MTEIATNIAGTTKAASVATDPVATVVNLTAPDTLHSNGADLSWSQYQWVSGQPFQSYEIHRSTAAGFMPSASNLIATIKDVAVTTYRDTTAAPGGTFVYAIVVNGHKADEQAVTLPADTYATKTLQPGPDDGEATTLTFQSGVTNCGNEGATKNLVVGATAAETRRSALRFDIRDIPSNAHITGATLSLWRSQSPALAGTLEVHRATARWSEGTGNATCSGDGATWYDSGAGTRWTTNGGDLDSSVSTASTFAAGDPTGWTNLDVTSLVGSWVSGGTPNDGVILKLADESGGGGEVNYLSDDTTNGSRRPKLVITYVDGSHATGPTVSLATPAAGAVSGSPTLVANTADDGHVDHVDFLVDGSPVATVAAAPFEYSWNSASVANGAHTIAVRATDDAGNSTTSSPVAMNVGNSAPPTASVVSVDPSPTTGSVTATNALTDATRSLGTQGDGNSSDSSYGIWQGATNLVTNGGFESNVTGWTGGTAGGGQSRDTAEHKFGQASMKVVHYAWGGGSGSTAGTPDQIPVTAGTTYTASAWVKLAAGSTVNFLIEWTNASGGTFTTSTTSVSGNGSWQRVFVSAAAPAGAVSADLQFNDAGLNALTYSIDGVQLEASPVATPYVETNGGTASRSAGRVQATATLLSATQGWVAARVRMGGLTGVTRRLFWLDDGSDTGQTNRISGSLAADGSTQFGNTGNATQTFSDSQPEPAAGAMLTLVYAWTASTLYVSRNGAAFTSQARAQIPSGLTSLDFGSQAGASNWFDGDMLWVAGGSGTLSNADAATLNGYGNTDPTIGSLPGAPSFAWDGATDTYAQKTIPGGMRVRANASDDLGVTQVDFLADGVKFAQDNTAPYEATWSTLDPSNPAYDGQHAITIRSWDAQGQSTTSAPMSVSISNAANTPYLASITAASMPTTALYDPAATTQQQLGVSVTVTNRSAGTWSGSDIGLRARWVDATGTSVSDGTAVPLGADLAAGASTTIPVLVTPPAMPEGVRRVQYRLRLDLYQSSTSTWFASKGNQPLEAPVIVNKVLATGLGLERYYQYNGADLGAGLQSVVNLASGNGIVHWAAFQEPGQGLSTVVDLTYNSLEGATASPVGNGFSLSVSSLMRLGSPLDIHPNASDTAAGRSDRYVDLTDGDGTTHRFTSTDGVTWLAPAGVHLYFRRYSTSDAARAWAVTRPDGVTFFFDTLGYPTFVKDTNGNQLTFQEQALPDGTERVTSVVDQGGRSIALTYYSATDTAQAAVVGRLKTLTDHVGTSLAFDYDPTGNLLHITEHGAPNMLAVPDRTIGFAYGADGRMSSEIDPRGHSTAFTYQSDGKLATRVDRNGATTSFTYDTVNSTTTVTPPTGTDGTSRASSYLYDAEGKVTQITNPLGQHIGIAWDSQRNVTRVTEPSGKHVDYAYNDNGQLTDSYDELGDHTLLEYQGVPVDSNDVAANWEAGRTIAHISRLIRKTDPNGTATATAGDYQWQFAYDANGNVTTVTDPTGAATTYTYGAGGTVSNVTDARGDATTFSGYDNNGLATKIVDAEGQTTTLAFDYAGRLLWIQDPNHANDGGTGVDPRTYKTMLDYDGFGRLVDQSAPKSTKYEPGVIIWSGGVYDANDNVVAQIAPYYASSATGAGATTTTTFDAMDHPTQVTSSGGSQSQSVYDADGRLVRTIAPRGVATTSIADDDATDYTYDALDRVIKATKHGDGSAGDVANTFDCYDLAGDLTRVTTANAHLASVDCSQGPPTNTTLFAYDAAHRRLSTTDPLGNVTSQTYDANGNTVTTTDASGTPTTVTFDQRNEPVKSVEELTASRNLTTIDKYDAVGNLAQLITPRAYDASSDGVTFNDYVTKYVYDKVNRLVRTDLPTGGGTAASYVHDAYDADGNLLWSSLPSDQPVAANVPNSLKTVQTYLDPGWIRTSNDPATAAVHFDYTAAGQQAERLPEDNSGSLSPEKEMLWSYTPNGQLAEMRDAGGQSSVYSYDADGNVVSATLASGLASATQVPMALTMSYDGFDRLASVTQSKPNSPDSLVSTYGYDLEGNLLDRVEGMEKAPDGTTVSAGRHQATIVDALGRPTSEIDYGGDPSGSGDDYRTVTQYTATGLEQSRTTAKPSGGGGWTTDQSVASTYYLNGLLKTQTTTNGAGDTLEQHTLNYLDMNGLYANGNKTSDTFTRSSPDTSDPCRSSACTATYSYDALGHLIQESDGTGTSIAYTVDPSGNVLDKATTIGTTTTDDSMTYIGQQLQTETMNGTTQKYFYTPEGNLSCVTTAAGVDSDCFAPTGWTPSSRLLQAYGYDYRNRLVSARTFDSGTVTSSETTSYDALDRPVQDTSKTSSTASPITTVVSYLGLSSQVGSEQLSASGATTSKSYAYDATGLRVGMTAQSGASTDRYTYGYDADGNVSILQQAGAAKASYGYTAYGAADSALTSGDSAANPLNAYRYSAKRLDPGSGLLDMGARLYSPDQGRFMQADQYASALGNLGLSSSTLTGNRYALAGANPIGFVEADGHYLAPAEYDGSNITGGTKQCQISCLGTPPQPPPPPPPPPPCVDCQPTGGDPHPLPPPPPIPPSDDPSATWCDADAIDPCSSDGRSLESAGGAGGVYAILDMYDDNRVVYIGRTNNFARRLAEHRQGRFADADEYKMAPVWYDDESSGQGGAGDLTFIRVVEQAAMDHWASLTNPWGKRLPTFNKIRSIAERTYDSRAYGSIRSYVEPIVDRITTGQLSYFAHDEEAKGSFEAVELEWEADVDMNAEEAAGDGEGFWGGGGGE